MILFGREHIALGQADRECPPAWRAESMSAHGEQGTRRRRHAIAPGDHARAGAGWMHGLSQERDFVDPMIRLPCRP